MAVFHAVFCHVLLYFFTRFPLYWMHFIATDMHLLRFLKVLLTVKTKKKVNSTRILYNTATAVELTSPEPAWIEAEGELAGMLPARVEMQKGRIWFLS